MKPEEHIASYVHIRDLLEAEMSATIKAYESGSGGFYDPATGKDVTLENIADLRAQIEKSDRWIKMWEAAREKSKP